MRKDKLIILTLLASNALLAFLFIREREKAASPLPISQAIEQTELAKPAKQEGAPSIQDLAESSATRALEEENRRLQKEVDDLKNEISVYNASRQRPRAATPKLGSPNLADPIFSMLEDHATVELALDWIRADQSRRFASLIALSGLDPERKEMLVGLLVDRYAHRTDLNKFGTDVLPEKERQAIDATYQQELRSLVGGTMAELFLKAETKPLSFTRIQEIDTLMRFGDEALTQEQYLPIWNLLSNTVQVGVRMNDAASVIEVTERSISNNFSMLTEAQALLSPSQYAIFEDRILSDITQTRVQQHLMLQGFAQRANAENNNQPDNQRTPK